MSRTERTTMSYKGWTNYETWCVSLWLHNELGPAKGLVGLAEVAWELYEHEDDAQSRSNDARSVLAGTVEALVDGMAPTIPASMFSDILSAALSGVNWIEIADNELDALDVEGYVAL